MKYLIVFVAILFVGCGSSSSQTSPTKETSPLEVTVVDGYIKDANVTDANGQVASYTGSNGTYKFTSEPVHPISSTGGVLEDTNLSFDINMSSDSEMIISPISTFITDTTIKNNLLIITGLSEDELLSDYIKNDNILAAKLAVMLYAMQKDTNISNTFKTTVTNTTTNIGVDALFDLALSDSNLTAVDALLIKTKSYSGTASQLELELNSTKQDISNGLYANNNVVHGGITYGLVVSPNTSKIWLDRNMGATAVCGTKSDSNCTGTYYQWGSDGESFYPQANVTDDWASDDADRSIRTALWNNISNGVCPVGFRVPTKAEIEAEAASISDSDDAFASFLKIPAGGAKLHNASITSAGSNSALWSITRDTNAFYFWDGTYPQDVGDVVGLPIRCIQN
jgi:hypothetical protein